MSLNEPHILVVDDDPMNCHIVKDYLNDIQLNAVEAHDNESAWQALMRAPEQYQAVLLDRNMPSGDGIELLKKIKLDPKLKMLPVIIQTGLADEADILEGLEAGAYYYLTKPLEREKIQAIVRSAMDDFKQYCLLSSELVQTNDSLKLLQHGKFQFRTLEEARQLASLLAKPTDHPDKVSLGLVELMLNAIEHGNLGISYEDKCALMQSGTWLEEIESRLQNPKYQDKIASIEYVTADDYLEFIIEDEGDGFDWSLFIDFSPERVFDAHGRGIAVAKNMSFDELTYLGKGNRVRAMIKREPIKPLGK